MNLNFGPGGVRGRFKGYSGARPDVIRLVPQGSRRILDVGCGAGMTAELLREREPHVQIVGVEPDASLAELARKQVDHLLAGKIDDPKTVSDLAMHGPFDVVICADVLEHMAEPQAVLHQLLTIMRPGGLLVTSIPNVRHASTFFSLGIMGTWPRRDRGIHDRTHLRFFARADIIDMATSVGLRLVRERRNVRLLEAHAWTMVPARVLDFWPLRPFVTFQYLHAWRHVASED